MMVAGEDSSADKQVKRTRIKKIAVRKRLTPSSITKALADVAIPEIAKSSSEDDICLADFMKKRKTTVVDSANSPKRGNFRREVEEAEDDEIERKESGSSYRNSLNLFEGLISKARKSKMLGSEHIKCLKSTPFFKLINLVIENKLSSDDISKHSKSIDMIIESFSFSNHCFTFGFYKENLKVEDVGRILGMECAGEILSTSSHLISTDITTAMNDFLIKYFKDPKTIKSKEIEASLFIALKGERRSDVMDSCRLIIMHLVATYLLSNANYSFPKVLLPYIFSPDKMRSVSWPGTVSKHLMEQLIKNKTSPRKIRACVTLLLYWFCDFSNVISPKTNFQNDGPTAGKWKLLDVTPDRVRSFISLKRKEEIRMTSKKEKNPKAAVRSSFNEGYYKQRIKKLEERIHRVSLQNNALKVENKSLKLQLEKKEVNVTKNVEKEISEDDEDDNDDGGDGKVVVDKDVNEDKDGGDDQVVGEKNGGNEDDGGDDNVDREIDDVDGRDVNENEVLGDVDDGDDNVGGDKDGGVDEVVGGDGNVDKGNSDVCRDEFVGRVKDGGGDDTVDRVEDNGRDEVVGVDGNAERCNDDVDDDVDSGDDNVDDYKVIKIGAGSDGLGGVSMEPIRQIGSMSQTARDIAINFAASFQKKYMQPKGQQCIKEFAIQAVDRNYSELAVYSNEGKE